MSPYYKLEELTQKLVLLLNVFVILVRWLNSEPHPGMMTLLSSLGEGKLESRKTVTRKVL